MDTTVRKIDEKAYRALKAKAALTGRTIGEVINEAIQAYLARAEGFPKRGSLRDLTPRSYPKGSERLSEELDTLVYGS